MEDSGRQQNPWRYTTAGLEFTVIFAAFVGIGYLLDTWLLGEPGPFTVWGAVIGFATALYRLIKQAKQAGGFDKDDHYYDDPSDQQDQR